MKMLSLSRVTLFAIAILFSNLIAPSYTQAQTNQTSQEKEPKRSLIYRLSPNAIPELRLIRTKGIDSDDWLNELELEYKNFSDKPIYYVLIYIILSETEPYGGTAGFRLEFGDLRLSNQSEYATSDDIALKPGESHVFKIKKDHIKNHQDYLERWTGQPGFSPPITKVELYLYRISFGDGTFYSAGQFFSRKK
jgi:hypothetical protein